MLHSDPFGLTSWARQVKNNDDAFAFAVHTGLISLETSPECSCGALKVLSNRADRNDLQWVCSRRTSAERCRIITSITVNTWFDNIRIPILTALELTLYWFFQVPVTSAAGQCGVSKECAVDWYSYCRQVCFIVVANQDICIGGPGLHVEIDESHLWKRKYQRGRILANQDIWIFGGVCRESKEAFMTLVPDRRGVTLWPIIQRRVAAGSVIMTDEARVYQNLHYQQRGGFEHYQVNHSLNFVHPDNPNVYTNTIEAVWRVAKGKVRGYVNDEQIEMYLGEFMYRRQYLNVVTDRERRTLGKQLETFLSHIKAVFPGPGQDGLTIPD